MHAIAIQPTDYLNLYEFLLIMRYSLILAVYNPLRRIDVLIVRCHLCDGDDGGVFDTILLYCVCQGRTLVMILKATAATARGTREMYKKKGENKYVNYHLEYKTKQNKNNDYYMNMHYVRPNCHKIAF